MQNDKEILNIKEASQFLNCSVSTIRNLIYDNRIPFHLIGNRYYFIKDNLINWLESMSRNVNF